MFGTVKWFSSEKGYGFIVPDEGEDIFVHYSGIKGDGYKMLEEGYRVKYDISYGDNGTKAIEVIVLDDESISYEEKYQVIDRLEESGNGVIYLVKCNTTGKNLILKELKQEFYGNWKRYQRFKDEIKSMNDNSDLNIMSIIDFSLPYSPQTNKTVWYVMPISIPMHKYDFMSIEEKFSCILEISQTLEKLHGRGVYHRDIKPNNLFNLDGLWIIGDFGLVDFPKKQNVTNFGESVGPRWTLAPEMKRVAKNSDGAKADVYSLAKTLWIILTDNEKGFDGKYDDNDDSIKLRNFVGKVYIENIKKLLTQSTENDSELRPSISEFIKEIEYWLKYHDDYETVSFDEWEGINNQLFKQSIPGQSIWFDIQSIYSVLKLIVETTKYNHTFFPDGGGLDLDDVSYSKYNGLLELNFGGVITLFKPSLLIYENIDGDADWSYFWFGFEQMEIESIYKDNPLHYETVTEIGHNKFVEQEVYIYKHYQGEKIPDESRQVIRYFKEGALVIFAKNSIYNRLKESYNAPHSLFSYADFRNIICTMKRTGINLLKPKVKKEQLSKEAERKIELFRISNEKSVEELMQEVEGYTIDFTQDSEKQEFLVYAIDISIGNSLVPKVIYRLFKDGTFKKIEYKVFYEAPTIDMDNHYIVYSRKNILKLIESVKTQIDMLSTKISISIRQKRIRRPAKLFSKEEITEVFKNANDKNMNQLVIEGDGSVKMLNVSDKNLLELLTYSVRNQESFPAKGNYVGPYSSIDDIDELYYSLLKSFYDHLSLDKHICLDLYTKGDVGAIEDLLHNEIKKMHLDF